MNRRQLLGAAAATGAATALAVPGTAEAGSAGKRKVPRDQISVQLYTLRNQLEINLDASLRVQMRRELLSLQRKLGLTTVFVTHDQEEANSTCDRIAVLDKGVIQQVGRPQDLYDHPVNLFVARFLGTANILEGRVEKAGEALRFVTLGGDSLPIGGAGTGAASIVLRPQNIAIAGETGPDTIAGQVLHSEFLGSQIRYIVSAAGSELVVDTSHRQGETTLTEGTEIPLRVNMQSAVVLHA